MKKLTKYQWQRQIETKIYNAQELWIEKYVSKKAAKKANYGWFTEGSDKSILIATKIYGHGVLGSSASYPSLEIHHKFEGDEEEEEGF